ncbi:MAG TPA: SpoIIE family protein phosphatase [Terriglobales bacterium]|nr:SpoIIE family protein phosphatase [Terriglobales bacterium]
MAETDNVFRSQLLERRHRLETAMHTMPATGEIEKLLSDVDKALERIEHGTYGLCETCHDAIEPERLMADPLMCYCLDHLTQSQRHALQQDLDLAVEIQSALLPSRNMKIAGWEAYFHYQPAGPVSGDYCDLIPVQNDGGGLLFLAGDVSGKGVAASLLMSNLHAIFRSLYSPGMSLLELIKRANHVFCENTMSSFYATLLCGLAHSSGEVEICNAGHLPPVILRSGEVVTLGATGMPLGLFCDAEFTVCRAELKPGESLVLYTDGLTEARNSSDDEYGRERLLQLLAECNQMTPKHLADRCVKELLKFVANRGISDDVTIMVLQRSAA